MKKKWIAAFIAAGVLLLGQRGIKPEDFRHHQPVCLPKPEGTIPCKWHTGAVPRLFRRYFLQQPAFFP